MLSERIYLSDDKRAYLDTYVSDFRNVRRDAMLVIPGGGYNHVCSDREGELVALAYFAKGFNAFMLNYRVGEATDTYPTQLIDACRAVLHIRENNEKYFINPDRIFAVGFSAGGHLAGSLGILSKDKSVLDTLGVSSDAVKIRGIVLAYPVVTAMTDTHFGSFEKLSGIRRDQIPDEIKRKLSLEEHVDENSPPAFIWHTAEDAGVPVVGSLRLAESYVKNKVPVALHVYPYGGHGLALSDGFSNNNPESAQPLAARWLSDSVEFIKTLK